MNTSKAEIIDNDLSEPAKGASDTSSKNEPLSIAQGKQLVCKKLNQIFCSHLMQERLLKMAGGDSSRVAKNLTAFLSLITQDDGSGKDPKKYYYQCSLSSLTSCFLESMNMQLPFDSRKLVSMVIYDWEAELDISYKGFVNALNKHYDNAYVDAKLVFKDDTFECEESGRVATFKHIAKDPFRTIDKDFKDIAGGYCFFSYTDNEGAVSRIVRMSRDDILKIKSKAKTQNVWNEFPSEMGVKAVLRRGSKIPFAAIDLDVDIEEVANRHFELEKPPARARLENLMKAQEEVVNEEKAPTQAATDTAAQDDKPDVEESPSTEAPAGNEKGSPDQTAVSGQDDKLPEQPPGAGRYLDSAAAPTQEETDAANTLPPNPKVEHPNAKVAPWDRKTIFTGQDKLIEKDWEEPAALHAAEYLMKIMKNRKHKSSRQMILAGNSSIINALLEQGMMNIFDDLHKIATEGE